VARRVVLGHPPPRTAKSLAGWRLGETSLLFTRDLGTGGMIVSKRLARQAAFVGGFLCHQMKRKDVRSRASRYCRSKTVDRWCFR
jgi:hypothetical protein